MDRMERDAKIIIIGPIVGVILFVFLLSALGPKPDGSRPQKPDPTFHEQVAEKIANGEELRWDEKWRLEEERKQALEKERKR